MVREGFDMVKEIWKTFWILLVVTILEIGLALTLTGHVPQMLLNVFYILASLAKAFYIVAVFMHLKFERKYLIITVLLPMVFMLFAVVVLLVEGDWWYYLKRY
ncbi:MAG: cytochrome C oxidase subunit IV family protein [Chitinophagales bacterium]|nr:cytochrome C oxidase subunit IV family protein [Chitinophagales bacterium]MDW8428582.1 cytochrome C oxidase subunit IV family protein [Chitinophagales bacterium]